MEEAVERVLDAARVTTLDEHARQVGTPQVLAPARRDDPVERDAGEPRLLRALHHARHALAPLAEHLGGELQHRSGAWVEEVSQDVDLAAVQLAGKLAARA